MNSYVLSFFFHFWPYRNNSQGQPKVIIWTILKISTIYGYDGHTGYVTWTVWTYFRFPNPCSIYMKIGYN